MTVSVSIQNKCNQFDGNIKFSLQKNVQYICDNFGRAITLYV